jgi:hypothetical protein
MTTTMLKGVFAEEIAACGGEVRDTFDDTRRLFLRSILPEAEEVRPRDRVQGGVALRFNGSDVWVHPYIFRQVCSNGAIMAQSLQTRHITDLELLGPDQVLPQVREAIQQCAAPAVFHRGAGQMRGAQEVAADVGITLISSLGRVSPITASQILRFLFESQDRSVFGLANAITATARDTSDEDLRWELEELGGGVFANPQPGPPHRDGHAARRFDPAEEILAR